MKIVLLIAALGVGGFLITREVTKPKPMVSPIAPPSYVPGTAAPSLAIPATAATALRRPIVKTHEVLGQEKERNGDGEF